MTSSDPQPDAAGRNRAEDSHDDAGDAGPSSDAWTHCAFCARISNDEYEATDHPDDVVTFEPLNPVTPGHRLFVPVRHVKDAATDPYVTAVTFTAAASYASEHGVAFNLITSAGSAATQTVYHLHVHYVPRRAEDGLLLPWNDAADKAAGIVRVDTRDEALKQAIYEWITGQYPQDPEMRYEINLVFHALAALRGEQHG